MRNIQRTLMQFFLLVTFGVLTVNGRAADAEPTDALASLDATSPTFMVIYHHGANWVAGKPMREQQSMRAHFLYYLGLHRNGQLIAAGGFNDESGGAAVFRASDDAAAAEIVAADPAVKSNLFRFELQRWKPNDWEDSSKRSAARGE